jgi:hypothetical protein
VFPPTFPDFGNHDKVADLHITIDPATNLRFSLDTRVSPDFGVGAIYLGRIASDILINHKAALALDAVMRLVKHSQAVLAMHCSNCSRFMEGWDRQLAIDPLPLPSPSSAYYTCYLQPLAVALGQFDHGFIPQRPKCRYGVPHGGGVGFAGCVDLVLRHRSWSRQVGTNSAR